MIRRAATSAAVRVSSMLAAASKSRPSDCSFQMEPATRPFLYRDDNLIAGRPFPDCSRNVKHTAFERSSSLQSSSSSSSSTINIMDDDNDKDQQQPILFLYHSNRGNRLLTPLSLQDDGSLSATKYSISPPFEEKDGVINRTEKEGAYCSDGVFCYPVGDDEVFVWNPTTSETRKLPDSPFTPPPGVTKTDVLTATWADPKSEDYKVIRLFSFSWVDTVAFQVRRCVEIELYSLKSDSWKKMIEEELPLPLCVYDHCYTNGVIHITHNVGRGSSFDYFILSFDFRSETFSTSPVPRSATKFLYHLVNYNGQPSILSITDRVNRDDLRTIPHYVMRKNGEWDIVGEYLVNLFYGPLGFARNGELLLLELRSLDFEARLVRTKVGVFDSTTAELKHVPGIYSFLTYPHLFEFHETFVDKLKPASSREQGGTEDNGLTTEAVLM